MALPKNYSYLLEADAPKIIKEAVALFGTREIVGLKHNQTILAWADAIGIGQLVNDDEQAWCGLFCGYVATRAQKHVPMQSWDILRALKWVDFGKKVPPDQAALGDILIFKRDGGGHVGLYVGEDAQYYYVLGGNQGNEVSITKIAKPRLYAVRRPLYINQPASVKKIFLQPNGTPVSVNEA
jgi:uncharacterized protein (TIGR02594 family)